MSSVVAFRGKQPMSDVTGAHFSLWRYEVDLDAGVTSGELWLGFSRNVDIRDPADFPGVLEVQDTVLRRGLEPVQFVAVAVALAVGGKVDVHLIAPSASDTFTAVTLANFIQGAGVSSPLLFTTDSASVANTSQVLEGPAATRSSAATGPGATPTRLLPYASEPFGVYQPLIGWRSELSKGRLADATSKQFRQAAAMIGEAALLNPERPIADLTATRISDRTGTRVGRLLASELRGRTNLPTGAQEWREVLGNAADSPLTSATRIAIETLRREEDPSGRGARDDVENEAAAATLLHHLGQVAPDVVAQMFVASIAPWERAVAAAQWYTAQHGGRDAFLSPIGILHLFREYFFELGTFLGPPVGQVWLSPGGTVELVEVNTRRTLVERTAEQSTETVQKSEISQTDQDEISDAVKIENANDTKLGVTASASGGVAGIFQASASASFNLDSSRKQGQEQTHKHMRDQSSKLSSEVRENFKTTFRTVTETTDTSSRRYVLQNTTDELVSYELSRKMRKVAVQVQDLGQQLCWQLYVDKPGDPLGIGEFVHATGAALDPSGKPPNTQPPPPNIEKTFPFSLPFIHYHGADHDAEDTYQTRIHKPDPFTAKYGNINLGSFDPDSGSENLIKFRFDFELPAPPSGYVPHSVGNVDFHGAEVAFTTTAADLAPNPNANKVALRLTYANFRGLQALPLDITVVYVPSPAKVQEVDAANAAAKTAYDDNVAHAKEAAFYDTLRSRLKLLGQVRPRPQDDLREEERNVIYRAIIARLYGTHTAGWAPDDYHVASELIRYLFDVDAMLYFVAPDWWRPRSQALASLSDQGELQPTVYAEPAVSDAHVLWGGYPVTVPGHRPYYPITEESAPAPMGASLGWLIQLDGDAHRNAFLNSPWVKTVLPIRPGREREAIAWLGRPEVAGTDGLSEPYPFDPAADPPKYKGKTISDVLLLIADEITQEHTQSQTPVKVDPGAVKPQLALPAETVFTHGFDPLEGGINLGAKPFTVFSEWLEILPTDQVVATKYSLDGIGT